MTINPLVCLFIFNKIDKQMAVENITITDSNEEMNMVEECMA